MSLIVSCDGIFGRFDHRIKAVSVVCRDLERDEAFEDHDG